MPSQQIAVVVVQSNERGTSATSAPFTEFKVDDEPKSTKSERGMKGPGKGLSGMISFAR